MAQNRGVEGGVHIYVRDQEGGLEISEGGQRGGGQASMTLGAECNQKTRRPGLPADCLGFDRRNA